MAQSAKTLLLKLCIANGKHFVHDKDLRFQVRGDRKGEADVHSAAVPLHWSVEELLYVGEGDDLVELSLDLEPLHSQDGAVEEDVLPPSQLGMKSCSHLEQACDPPENLGTPCGWLGDAAKDLQQCTLARAIAADNPENFSLL